MFQFAESKSHQTGESHVGPWHVYANPQKPWLCPVLSLARFLFCPPDVLQGDVPLFEGDSQYERYSKVVFKLVWNISPELKRLVFKGKMIWAHIHIGKG